MQPPVEGTAASCDLQSSPCVEQEHECDHAMCLHPNGIHQQAASTACARTWIPNPSNAPAVDGDDTRGHQALCHEHAAWCQRVMCRAHSRHDPIHQRIKALAHET